MTKPTPEERADLLRDELSREHAKDSVIMAAQALVDVWQGTPLTPTEKVLYYALTEYNNLANRPILYACAEGTRVIFYRSDATGAVTAPLSDLALSARLAETISKVVRLLNDARSENSNRAHALDLLLTAGFTRLERTEWY